VFLDRAQQQEEIYMFIEQVFGKNDKIALEEFNHINEQVSSEMFLAVRFIKY